MRRVVAQHLFLIQAPTERSFKSGPIVIARHYTEQYLPKPVDRLNTRIVICAHNSAALIIRQPFLQHLPFFRQAQQPLSPIGDTLCLFDEPLADQLAEHSVEALLGDLQDNEEL